MLSCEVWETFKNNYFEDHLQTTASEVFYEKAVLKNFAIFIGRKQVMIKCSVKKVFLVVDRAVKVTCFYIDHDLL